MRCRILPADAAVPAEVHQRLITELAAAGLELAAEGPGPLLVVDADALVGREEFRMMMYAPGGDRVLVARDHGHGIVRDDPANPMGVQVDYKVTEDDKTSMVEGKCFE